MSFQKSIYSSSGKALASIFRIRSGHSVSRMGNLNLLPCEPQDAAEILAGQIAAFSNPREPFFFVLFPEDEDRERAVKRTLDWWLGVIQPRST